MKSLLGKITWFDQKFARGAVLDSRGRSWPFYLPKAWAGFPEFSLGRPVNFQILAKKNGTKVASILAPRSVVNRLARVAKARAASATKPAPKTRAASKSLDARIKDAIDRPYNYCKPKGGPVRDSPSNFIGGFIVPQIGGRKPGGRFGGGQKHH